MAQAPQKILLSSARDIPFNKLILSQSNVRSIKTGVTIDELAEDIARRTLLQSLSVRPVIDADGNETGMFEVPAGGRRYRALELLVRQKRLAKTALVSCVVREATGDVSAVSATMRAPAKLLSRAFGRGPTRPTMARRPLFQASLARPRPAKRIILRFWSAFSRSLHRIAILAGRSDPTGYQERIQQSPKLKRFSPQGAIRTAATPGRLSSSLPV